MTQKETIHKAKLHKKQWGRSQARLSTASEQAEIDAKKYKQTLTNSKISLEVSSLSAPARLGVEPAYKKRSSEWLQAARNLPEPSQDTYTVEVESVDLKESEGQGSLNCALLDTQENMWIQQYYQNSYSSTAWDQSDFVDLTGDDY